MKQNQGIKAVIFDMDGVLFDSERFGIDLWKAAEQKFGFTGSEVFIDKMIGTFTSEEEVLRLHVALLGEKLGHEVRAWRKKEYLHYMEIARPALKKGAQEILRALRELGVPRALATSSDAKRVTQYFSGAGIPCDLEAIVTREDIVNPKPAPDIYLEAARRLDVAIEGCAIIEDSPNGVRGAHSAGGYVIMVPDIVQPDKELRTLADFIAADLDEVLEVLCGFII